MAWSPVRRFNAGRFEVDHPGDYATLNSYQLRDGSLELGALRCLRKPFTPTALLSAIDECLAEAHSPFKNLVGKG
jgi:hypothetical protein